MSRKSDLKQMFSERRPLGIFPPGEGPSGETPVTAAAPGLAPGIMPRDQLHPPRTASGAVKAMGLSLGDLAERAGEADRLKVELAALKSAGTVTGGDRVVELDPALIDPSPFADRLSAGTLHDSTFDALVASIRESGQQVPVLVRPSPAGQGRYQAAYGHRRIRASRALGQPVRAVIKLLDDEALMLAQGKENAERRDLSFIERALFAQTLAEAGFTRAAVQSALGVHASELTRLLQVAEGVPAVIIRAIGPAPKIGRPRWLALGELLKTEANQVKAQSEIHSQPFLEADTDSRFKRIFDRLSARQPQGKSAQAKADAPRPILDMQGNLLGQFSGGTAPAIIFAADEAAFAQWLAENLHTIRQQFITSG